MKRLTPLAVLLILPGIQLFAQEGKLKTVQTTSVWAPANVKVDGSLKEWDDTFQAYNKTTKIFYTLCNDDKNLYFIVKSIDVQNNAKIIAGGITLVLNTEGKKKDKDAYSLTFPNIPRPTRGQGGGRGAGGGGGAPGGGGRGGGGGGFGGGNRGQAPDSAAIAARQKQTIESAKEIKVLGFKDVTDTLISIYNEFSIKAAISYDKLGNYDYEMAIPLKALNLTPGDAKEIAYHITVNGLQMPANFQDRQGGQGGGGAGGAAAEDGAGGGTAGGGGAAGGRGGGAAAGGGRGGRGGAPGAPAGGAQANRGPDPDMFSPTDFWGKYTLAKK